jgi:hypothetical protein
VRLSHSLESTPGCLSVWLVIVLLSTVNAPLADAACINGAACLWIKLWKLWIAVQSYVVAGVGPDVPRTGPVARIVNGAGPLAPYSRRSALAVARLRWSGDPGVLTMRHSVECPRTATRMVSPLPRGADGAAGGRAAAARPAMEFARWPPGGYRFAAPRVAADAAAIATGLPVDSRAPRRRAGGRTQAAAPRTHTALRRDTPLGSDRSRRAGS